MNKLITDYVAVDLDDRPSSLVDCLTKDGLTLDPLKYLQYQDKEDELGDLMLKMLMSYKRKSLALASVQSRKKIAKKSRKVQALTPYYFDDDGNKIYVRQKPSYWYLMYVKCPAIEDNKFNVKFRRRFRMPYGEYKKLLDNVK